jgi:hypothetical protein
VENAALTLPIPAQDIFEIPEKSFAVIAASPHHVAQTALAEPETDEDGARRTIRGKRHSRHYAGRYRPRGVAHLPGHGSRQAAHAHRGALKRLVQVKKRSV